MKQKKCKTWILKLDRDDPEKELEFEVRWQLSLTPENRFQMMFEKAKITKELLRSHGHSPTPQIVKRS